MAYLSPEKSTIYKKLGTDSCNFAKRRNAELSTDFRRGQSSLEGKKICKLLMLKKN